MYVKGRFWSVFKDRGDESFDNQSKIIGWGNCPVWEK